MKWLTFFNSRPATADSHRTEEIKQAINIKSTLKWNEMVNLSVVDNRNWEAFQFRTWSKRRIHKQLQVNRNELHSPFGSEVSCHTEKTQTNESLIWERSWKINGDFLVNFIIFHQEERKKFAFEYVRTHKLSQLTPKRNALTISKQGPRTDHPAF